MIRKFLNYKWEILSTIIVLILAKYIFGVMFHLDEFTLEESRVSKAVINEVEEKLNLKCFGLGGSAPHGKLYYMSFRFQSHKKTEIPQAREQLLEIANIYLKHINSSEVLKKYMFKYPFDIEDSNIAIFYQDHNFKAYQHPLLCTASVISGRLSYYTEDSQKNEFGYESETKENYDEALRKYPAAKSDHAYHVKNLKTNKE